MRIGIDARKWADYGIGRYIRGLLRGLASIRGDETYVVFAPAAAREAIPDGFEHVPADAPNYSIRELFALGNAIRKARLDLFHAPHYVVPFTRCPTVTTVHDLIHLHRSGIGLVARTYARTMLRRAVRKSARIITVSEAVKLDICDALGARFDRVVVTPNGIDERFRATAPSPAAGYFLFVGNDKPHKNVERLVRAFDVVHAEHRDASLLLVGGGFERFASRPGVSVRGFVDDGELADLYRGALALMQPSIEEGFGLPAAEAMASGTAVIASTDEALVDLTGEAALHAHAESVEEIAAAMRHIVHGPELRLALGRRGIERSRDLTWERCAGLTRAVYLEVLAPRSAA